MVWTCRSDKEDICLYNSSGETAFRRTKFIISDYTMGNWHH